MPLITKGFGTIAPFSGSCKIGLDDSSPPIVKAVSKSAIAEWTVQNFDNAPDCYRLFVNDGERDYALSASEDKTSISAFEGSPASSDSHVWYILEFPDGYYYIQDILTRRAWKLNGNSIALASLPVGNDGLKPFKFRFTFFG
ncbi:hypothetical protein HD554DRAFT_2165654 [Boletus coccyginus]|nr:hypothetical protein HD554DRAFT_2165654 [Boletus coccyginus]